MTSPRFACDMMLGRLAKWLRLFGYNAVYFHEISDASLLRLAREEGRVLLTRDTKLMDRRPIRLGQVKAVFIKDDGWRAQLSQLTAELDLRPQDIHLCAVCNRPLVAVERAEIENEVPPYVRLTQHDFRRCVACGRIYWPATHWEKIQAAKDDILGRQAHAG